MTLIELLTNGTDYDCGFVVDGAESPVDIVFYSDDTITADGYNDWFDVLNADATYNENDNYIEVNARENRGINFAYALAGYCSQKDYDKWFKA